MTDTITCKYSCPDCNITDQEVEVPIRDARVSVVDWFENIAIEAMCQDHFARNPTCQPTELERVMIPVPEGTTMVGMPVIN